MYQFTHIVTWIETKDMEGLFNEREELLRENQSLRIENQELADLVKCFEKGVETSTKLVRDHAVFFFSPHAKFPVQFNYQNGTDSSGVQREAQP